MIDAIVFSMNRPMQLEALLRSASTYLLEPNPGVRIRVLFGATSRDYAEGYATLKELFSSSGRLTFVEENRHGKGIDTSLLFHPRNLYRFIRYPYTRRMSRVSAYKQQLESLLSDSGSDFVFFLTDDSLFWRSFKLDNQVEDLIRRSPLRRSFSLRHGLNMQNAPSGMTSKGQLYSWNMFEKDCDAFWSYNFSVDGHVYFKSSVLELIRGILYVNPNSFEGFAWNAARRKRLFGEAYCFRESVLLSFPINMVQTTVENESLGIDNEMLNRRFLEGYRLRYVHDPSPTRFQQVPLKLQIVKGEHVIDLLQSWHPT